jgi:hypothetical protein
MQESLSVAFTERVFPIRFNSQWSFCHSFPSTQGEPPISVCGSTVYGDVATIRWALAFGMLSGSQEQA